MIELIVIAGLIWLGLTLLQPAVAYADAKKDCDIKYAADRMRRTEAYAQMDTKHQTVSSSAYEKAAEKNVSNQNKQGNAKQRRKEKRKPLQEAWKEKHRKLRDGRKKETNCDVRLGD